MAYWHNVAVVLAGAKANCLCRSFDVMVQLAAAQISVCMPADVVEPARKLEHMQVTSAYNNDSSWNRKDTKQ